jgi:hypothetical protein
LEGCRGTDHIWKITKAHPRGFELLEVLGVATRWLPRLKSPGKGADTRILGGKRKKSEIKNGLYDFLFCMYFFFIV